MGRKFQQERTETGWVPKFFYPRIKKLEMRMPAPRKPTNILHLTGSFKHNPNRRRVDPPTHKPIGAAPKQTVISFKQAWNLIVKCCPDGVLADRDRIHVEIVASLLVQFRADPVNFHPAKLGRLSAMLSQLGMSPADASRVSATPKRTRGDFDD